MRTPSSICWWATACAVLLLAGCATRPPPEQTIETTRTVSAPPAEIAPRVADFLERRGIDDVRVAPDRSLVVGTQRPLEAEDWADCPTVRVRDPEGERRRRADPLSRRLDLEVTLERQGGRTLVAVQPVFIQTMRDSFTNTTFEARCASSGRLERALLGAV
ncbi:MAG TPA: hypothetical protein VFZ01_17685 [Geminicoccaceae bacterium]